MILILSKFQPQNKQHFKLKSFHWIFLRIMLWLMLSLHFISPIFSKHLYVALEVERLIQTFHPNTENVAVRRMVAKTKKEIWWWKATLIKDFFVEKDCLAPEKNSTDHFFLFDEVDLVTSHWSGTRYANPGHQVVRVKGGSCDPPAEWHPGVNMVRNPTPPQKKSKFWTPLAPETLNICWRWCVVF